jgi:hypothetical protein
MIPRLELHQHHLENGFLLLIGSAQSAGSANFFGALGIDGFDPGHRIDVIIGTDLDALGKEDAAAVRSGEATVIGVAVFIDLIADQMHG